MFAPLVGLNVAVGFKFLLSEVTCELTLRADPSCRQLAGKWYISLVCSSVCLVISWVINVKRNKIKVLVVKFREFTEALVLFYSNVKDSLLHRANNIFFFHEASNK